MPKEINSVVLEDSEHDVKKDGIKALNFDAYRAVALAGGFFDPLQDVGNHNAPLDIKGLRFLRDDPKADAGRRQAAGDRLAEIEAILADADAYHPGDTITDAAKKEVAGKKAEGK